MLVAYCRLCRHCRNLAEGGCLFSRFHFTCCCYFVGHVACRNLPWQGLKILNFFCKRTNNSPKFEGCFLRGPVSSKGFKFSMVAQLNTWILLPSGYHLHSIHLFKVSLRIKHKISIQTASDWSCCMGNLLQPIRSTTQIWVVTHHQYGISALISQTSFWGETSGRVVKFQLFSQTNDTHDFILSSYKYTK